MKDLFNSELGSKLMYSGDSDPIEWFKIFEIQSAINEWEDDSKVKFIGAFLDSKARRIYDDIVATDKDDYGKVKIAILNGCAKNCDSLLNGFLNSKRQTNESLSKFARRLQEMLIKALPSLTAQERTPLLRSQLCSVLPDNMKALVQFSSTFGEGNWDKVLDMLDRTLPDPTAAQIIKSGYDTIDVHNTSVNQNRGQKPPNQQRGQVQSCYTCGKPGHRAAQCRSGPNRNFGGSNNNGSSNNNYNNYNNGNNFSGYNNNFRSHIPMNMRPPSRPIIPSVYQQSFGYQPTQQYRPRMNTNSFQMNQFDESNNYQSHNDLNSNSTCMSEFPFYAQLQQYQSNNNNSNDNNQSNNNQNDGFQIHTAVLELEISTASLKFCLGENKRLLRIKVSFTLFGISHVMVARALVDGGSSHSFISPDLLNNAHKKILMCQDSMWVKRQMHRINGVIAGTDSMCCIVNSDIVLTSDEGKMFECEQEFVISGSVRSHDMILGRTWLHEKNVTIKHGINQMEIGEDEDSIVMNFLTYDDDSNGASLKSSGSDPTLKSETDARDTISELSEKVRVLNLELKLLSAASPKSDNKSKDLLDFVDLFDTKNQL